MVRLCKVMDTLPPLTYSVHRLRSTIISNCQMTSHSLFNTRVNCSGKLLKANSKDIGTACLARNFTVSFCWRFGENDHACLSGKILHQIGAWKVIRSKALFIKKLNDIGYKKKDDERHKDMHSLVGVFIKSDKEEQIDQNAYIYPFKIIFPMNKVRVYYCRNRDERSKWL